MLEFRTDNPLPISHIDPSMHDTVIDALAMYTRHVPLDEWQLKMEQWHYYQTIIEGSLGDFVLFLVIVFGAIVAAFILRAGYVDIFK